MKSRTLRTNWVKVLSSLSLQADKEEPCPMTRAAKQSSLGYPGSPCLSRMWLCRGVQQVYQQRKELQPQQLIQIMLKTKFSLKRLEVAPILETSRWMRQRPKSWRDKLQIKRIKTPIRRLKIRFRISQRVVLLILITAFWIRKAETTWVVWKMKKRSMLPFRLSRRICTKTCSWFWRLYALTFSSNASNRNETANW